MGTDGTAIVVDDNVDVSSTYTVDFKIKILPNIDKIFQWIKDGQTEYSIANQLGIHYNTFAVYKNKYNVIRELYTRACRERNSLVANAVFKKSNGHKAIINKQKVLQDGTVVNFQDETYIPPDTEAAKFWLINRDPENWKDKVEVTSNVSINFQLPEIQARLRDTLSELDKLQALEVMEFEVIPDG